jgi:hypothetical protein
MIDKTLARIIDETLRRPPKIFGFRRAKMLEVRANWAHLSGLLPCARAR